MKWQEKRGKREQKGMEEGWKLKRKEEIQSIFKTEA